MEQSPGSINNLQPQDLCNSSIPAVIDLTRNGDECVLNAASLDALRMVRSPGWYTNSTASNQETASSDIALQSVEHVQPDNAFSHTTVTLSYVSRSHIFSAHDSLSRHPPLYGVPPISKFSLHPSCDSAKGLGDTRFSLNQHFVVEGPLDLAIQPELLQSISQTDVAVCLTQDPLDFNCGVFSCDGHVDEQVPRNREELGQSQGNGRDDRVTSSVIFTNSSSETLTPTVLSDEKDSLGVLLHPLKKQDLVLIHGRVAAGDLHSLGDSSPLEDPFSPASDDIKNLSTLHQASCLPSEENSCLDDSNIEMTVLEGTGITRLDSTNVNAQHVRWKTLMEPIIHSTDDVCVTNVFEEPKPDNLHVNGNAKALLKRTVIEKKLPLRSSRGTRLEAIVMNTNPSMYNVSERMCKKRKANSFPPTRRNSYTTDSKRKESQLVGARGRKVRTHISLKRAKQKTPNQFKRDKNDDLNFDSTSISKSLIVSQNSQSRPSPKHHQLTVLKSKNERNDILPSVYSPPQTSPSLSKRRRSSQSIPQSAADKNSKKGPMPPSCPDPSVKIQVVRLSSPSSKSPKKCPGKGKDNAADSKTPPTAKTKYHQAVMRRRKKPKSSQASSTYFPKEPEIKFKYVNYKEKKRERRSHSFSPFISIKHWQSRPALCTIINYPELVRTQHNKGQLQRTHSSDFISADVPSTSCLQLGRPSTHSQLQRPLVCCLCGQSANAMDLGDLHGPYYPDGYQSSTKTPVSTSQLKEDISSDSDSSSCSNRQRKMHSIPSSRWPLKQNVRLGSQWWSGNDEGSPSAEGVCSVSAAVVEDWYSPPVLSQELCEHWLHEDCGIWSAGVFLVKGKVYGLEEAVKAAQETMCSACRHPGATLGCFFKGCLNKYHYRCALESECALVEENFSMKCKKHKDKLIKGSARNRVVNR